MTEGFIIQEFKRGSWVDMKKFKSDEGFEAKSKFEEMAEESAYRVRIIKREIIDTNFQ